MAVIKLTELSSFDSNLKSQNATNRINSLGIIDVYKNNTLSPTLLISDQKDISLILFGNDGVFYDKALSKEIRDIQSFKDLSIQSVNGSSDYNPELAWIDAGCGDKIYVLDAKLNTYNNTQHVVRYDKIYHPNMSTFTLEDAIVQVDNKKARHFAISESRSYDASCGGYPLMFYIIDENEKVLEFDTQNYRNRIIVNPKSLVWKPTSFDQKEGFVRLIENSSYWGNKEELIYSFGLDNVSNNFFLELVNLNSLQSNNSSTYYSNSTSVIPTKIKLNFGSCIDFNLNPLPKFDSASCLDDKEFLMAMIPKVNGLLDYSYRDIYWFRLQSSKDEAILLADPFRISNIDRFDGVKNCESPVCIKHSKEHPTLEDIIYLVTGQNEIKKFKIDLTP